MLGWDWISNRNPSAPMIRLFITNAAVKAVSLVERVFMWVSRRKCCLIVPYPKNTGRVVPVAGLDRWLLSRTPGGRPRRSIALRFHAARSPGRALSFAVRTPLKPRVAILGNPRNACVTLLEVSGKTFCAAAPRKPVIWISWSSVNGRIACARGSRIARDSRMLGARPGRVW